VELLIERASTAFALAGVPDARECDLIARGVLEGRERGFAMRADGLFLDDRGGEPRSAADLLALARVPGQELTFTCVYPGAGLRLGIDRDEDGTPDSADLDPGVGF
jgi:hypothetical protein